MNNLKKIILCTLSLATFNSYASSEQTHLPQWTVSQLPNKASLRGSAAVDNKLWVTGTKGSVYVSENLGQQWRNVSPSQYKSLDFRDIHVFDKQTAIIMSVGSGDDSKLLKTQDGGNSWALLYQNKDKEGFFDAIDFWDDKTGLMLGDPVDGYYVVKKTTDGGNTWRRIAKSKLPAIIEKESAFAASGNTLIVGEEGKAWSTTGGFSASVYESNDWGETWQRQAVPLYSETQTAGGYGLAQNTQGQIFVLGGDFQQRPAKYANIATKLDTWYQVDAKERGLRTAMSCYESICITTGKTGSDYSSDDGKTWQPLDNLQAVEGDRGFYTLANDGNIFVSAGAEGKVGVLIVK
ncbi:WD40/YVTN/BNR-like repeat-containing protein [Thalassotalea marina]|uniref:Oxidoreductase n=1 Tax=Thalassotalea marina TaxID=1673741 RepID=A0A919BCP3_9GAMM|nr:YCF48-related protein [Thalassotalea marina]GHF79776.1 hypothetical protein GCM10017161_03710 [Thalassotalea marina]